MTLLGHTWVSGRYAAFSDNNLFPKSIHTLTNNPLLHLLTDLQTGITADNTQINASDVPPVHPKPHAYHKSVGFTNTNL